MFSSAVLLSIAGFVAAQTICHEPIIFVAHATVFPATGQTACGDTNIPKDAFVAGLSKSFFDSLQPSGDSNPQDNPDCEKPIWVSVNSETWIEARVVERCAGCEGNDIILSPAAFKALTGSDSGDVAVNWAQFNPAMPCIGSN